MNNNQVKPTRKGEIALNILGVSLASIAFLASISHLFIPTEILSSSLFLLFTSLSGLAIIFYVFYFAKENRDKALYGLIGFSIFEGLSLASLLSIHADLGSHVLTAVFITSGLIFFGYKHALNSDIEYSKFSKYLFPALILLIALYILSIFISMPPAFLIGLSIFGGIIFFMYLLVDTQTLLRDENYYSPEIIAIILLIDILGLFKHVLYFLDGLDD